MTQDPTRRQFFRQLGRESIRNAGAVAGAAAEIRRAGNVAARDLLDLAEPAGHATGSAETPPIESGFNSAYRLGEGVLLALDQRELPGRMSILSLAEPSEVSSAIRSGVINGGPVLGEIAAYALWLAAERMNDADQPSRDQRVRAAANTLRTPRSDVYALRRAVDRMEATYDQFTADQDAGADPSSVAESLRAEADAIAGEGQIAHSSLGRVGAEFIALAASEADTPAEQPLSVLMHGDMGPLTSGMVGTGTAVLNSLAGMRFGLHVWLTEAAPSTEGARVAALQLTQMDVPHTVISNSAVAWLLSSRRVDAALLRGDTVTSNGDTLALIGSLNVATLATAADVPVFVIAPTTSFDEQSADARGLVLELRSPAESFAHRPLTPGCRDPPYSASGSTRPSTSFREPSSAATSPSRASDPEGGPDGDHGESGRHVGRRTSSADLHDARSAAPA